MQQKNDVEYKNTSDQRLAEVFSLQKKISREEHNISLDKRVEILNKLSDVISENQFEICEAINKDYGNRSHQETLMLEISGLLSGIKYTKKHLKKWARPQKRKVSLAYLGAKNTVVPQAKGVVGVVSPWNYPLFLAFSPCVSAIAAGNRCVIKMASNSQNLAKLMEGLLSKTIDEQYLSLVSSCSAGYFSSLPWDHLVFTGSAATGQQVMAAAASNLTPVTLELGGKSPVILCDDFDVSEAASRIMFTKLLNAGQTCVAPDYIFIPTPKVDEFIKKAAAIVSERYKGVDSKDYTSIINDKENLRLASMLREAESKGAKVFNLLPDSSLDTNGNKFPPVLVVNANDGTRVLKEEIFGPILPIIGYESKDEVLKIINCKDRPLAMYIFSNDKVAIDDLINNTHSGAVCINDSMFHVAQHDMPFGGVGNSGMGHYHAKEGFYEFSKLRPIFKQAKKSPVLKLVPPYGEQFDKIMSFILKFRL